MNSQSAIVVDCIATYWRGSINTRLPSNAAQRYSTTENAINALVELYNKQKHLNFASIPWVYAKNARHTAITFLEELPSFTNILEKLTKNDSLSNDIFTHIRENTYFAEVWKLPENIIFENLLLLLYRTTVVFLHKEMLFDAVKNTPLIQLSSTIEEMAFCDQLISGNSPLFFAYKHWLKEWQEEDFDERLYKMLETQL